MTSAAVLRVFLVKTKRTDAVAALDKEVAAVFVVRDGSKMKLLSQKSAQILMTAIMEYLGAHRKSTFIKAVVLASNERVAKLMASEQYAEAYDIANCAFEFALEAGFLSPAAHKVGAFGRRQVRHLRQQLSQQPAGRQSKFSGDRHDER